MTDKKPREFMHQHPDGPLERQDGVRVFHTIERSYATELEKQLAELKDGMTTSYLVGFQHGKDDANLLHKTRSCLPEFENDIDVAKREISDLRKLIDAEAEVQEEEIQSRDAMLEKLAGALKRIIDEGIDTSTDGGMSFVREAIADYEKFKGEK